jgi:hypothetical protein
VFELITARGVCHNRAQEYTLGLLLFLLSHQKAKTAEFIIHKLEKSLMCELTDKTVVFHNELVTAATSIFLDALSPFEGQIILADVLSY